MLAPKCLVCQLQNPVNNIADSENVWSFDTLRPDGVARAWNSLDFIRIQNL